MNAVHSTAQRTWSQRWQIVDGRPKRLWEKVDDTPYNVLDELYGAIRKLDRKFLLKRSLNRSIYRRLISFNQRVNPKAQQICFPHSYCDGNSKIIGLSDLKASFHFKRYHGRWVVWKIGPLSESK
jgi:hypothetical protein